MARSRSDALAWCVRLVEKHQGDWIDQLREALAAGARSVLLDNFPVERLREAVALCREQREYVFAEASGGVTLETVREIAQTGVDAVAVGAVTHSAPTLDLGLDWLAGGD